MKSYSVRYPMCRMLLHRASGCVFVQGDKRLHDYGKSDIILFAKEKYCVDDNRKKRKGVVGCMKKFLMLILL